MAAAAGAAAGPPAGGLGAPSPPPGAPPAGNPNNHHAPLVKPHKKRRGWACITCSDGRRRCEGAIPCDRCATINIACKAKRLAAASKARPGPESTGLLERAIVNLRGEDCREVYLAAMRGLVEEGDVQRELVVAQIRGWEATRLRLGGEDLTFGVTAELRRLFNVTDAELAGLGLPDVDFSLVEAANPRAAMVAAAKRNRAEPVLDLPLYELRRMVLAAQNLEEDRHVIASHDNETPTMLLAADDFGTYVATNEPYNGLFISAPAQVEAMGMEGIALLLLSLAWVARPHREHYLRYLLTLQFKGEAAALGSITITCLNNQGDARFYVVSGRVVDLGKGHHAVALTFVDAGPSTYAGVPAAIVAAARAHAAAAAAAKSRAAAASAKGRTPPAVKGRAAAAAAAATVKGEATAAAACAVASSAASSHGEDDEDLLDWQAEGYDEETTLATAMSSSSCSRASSRASSVSMDSDLEDEKPAAAASSSTATASAAAAFMPIPPYYYAPSAPAAVASPNSIGGGAENKKQAADATASPSPSPTLLPNQPYYYHATAAPQGGGGAMVRTAAVAVAGALAAQAAQTSSNWPPPLSVFMPPNQGQPGASVSSSSSSSSIITGGRKRLAPCSPQPAQPAKRFFGWYSPPRDKISTVPTPYGPYEYVDDPLMPKPLRWRPAEVPTVDEAMMREMFGED